ncbi:MAG: Gfo/Idh/MocA family oxidoreductase [Phycisphaerae bacterium]
MAQKVRWGVIGAGGIAYRKTIPGLIQAPNCELVAVMDVANIEKIAKDFNVPNYYTKEIDLLNDPAVQAVYIATPAHLHAKQIKLAAAKKKHILCEKPLTVSLKEAKESVAVCKKNKVFLQEGYMMKFHGAHQKIKELIEAGKLGKIVYMRAQLSCWYPPIKGAWRQDPKKGGGGALIDMATHLYDLLEYFAGKPKTVTALTGNLVQKYKSEDASTTLLEFKSGAHATVDCFYCIPDEASKTRLEIYGSRGAILAEGTIGQSVGGNLQGIFGLGETGYDAAQNKDVQRTFQNVPFEPINPYTAECEYFADCILKKKNPKINSGLNALDIISLTEKAYESYKKKKMMKI